jgi:glutathione S-transferase
MPGPSVNQVEHMLREQSPDGPFFLGPHLSIADLNCMPFIARLPAARHFKQFEVPRDDRFQRVYRWFDAVRLLPSFQKTVESDVFYLDHFKAHAARMQQQPPKTVAAQ